MRKKYIVTFSCASMLFLTLIGALLLYHPLEARANSLQSCGAWTIVPSPNAGTQDVLQGVAAISTSDAWAVGWSSLKTLIEHWNGTTWSVVPSPNAPGFSASALHSVASVSANDIWAVGDSSQMGFSPQTLTEHWNGTAWSIIASPNPSSTSLLGAITAISTNDVWAMGGSGTSSTNTLAEHWNGTAWSIVASPNPSGSTDNFFTGVTAVSTKNVWAVGIGSFNTLIEHWNGKKWHIVASPNAPNSLSSNLNNVAAVSGHDIWTVGIYADMMSADPTFVEHWNGKTWSVVPSPNPTNSNYNLLNGVAAISTTNVWAVGEAEDKNTTQSFTLVEHWDGTAWSIVASPNPGGSTSNVLDSVARVPGTSQLWAAGTYVNPSSLLTQTLIEFYC